MLRLWRYSSDDARLGVGVHARADQGHVGDRARGAPVGRATPREERGGPGVRDHWRGRSTGPPVRARVRSPPCCARAVGHQQPEQRGDRRARETDLPGTGDARGQRG